MLYDYAGDTFVYLVIMFVHLVLAVDSLKYHVTKYKSPRDQIQVFLENISYPLSLLFSSKPHFNAYTYSEMNDLLKYLAENHHQNYTRMLYAAIPFFMVVTNARALGRDQDLQQFIFQSVFLTINCYLFYRAWRFGHKLKNIEDAQS